MKTSLSRSITTTATILLLSLVVMGTAFQYMSRSYITKTAFDELNQDAQVISSLAGSYAVDGGLSTKEFLLNLDVASRVTGNDIVICNGAGKIVLCSDSLSGCSHQGLYVNQEYLEKVMEQGGDQASGVIQGLYSENRFLVSLPISGDDGAAVGMVIVSTPSASVTAFISRISGLCLSVSLIVVAIASLGISLLARRESRPLQVMAKAAYHFGHGDLESRVSVDEDCSEEVQELALAFNNMASSLQKSEYQRQEFVANVSHELKTPMTTISGYIDGILDGTIPPERQRHYLQIVSDETKRLSRLVRSMLDISQLQTQQGIPDEKKTNFDLEECAGQVLITFEKKINDKAIHVNVDMPEHPVYTFANQDYITQVIYNLLDNAVKFCPQGGNLWLTLKESREKVYVSVANEGDTIPPEELPLVFDRFHKLDKSRSQNRDGWGLGLYIVKTIICSHGEDISVTSRDGKTEFTFTLPLAPDVCAGYNEKL